jgi:hypothetical protein
MKRSDAGRAKDEMNGHHSRAKRRLHAFGASYPQATGGRGITRPAALFEVDLGFLL